MNLDLTLSLRDQSLVRLADVLWNGECMHKYLWKHYNNPQLVSVEREIDDIINTVIIIKISTLKLPDKIIDSILSMTKLVAEKKIRWYFFHEFFFNIKCPPSVFYWTYRGNINRKRTAEHWIKNKAINICNRYGVACFYCLEKDIQELHNLIPDRYKEYSVKCRHLLEYSTKYGLRNFWNYIMRGDTLNYVTQWNSEDCETESDADKIIWENERSETKIKSHREAYYYSLMTANSDAAGYFLTKRTPGECSSYQRNRESSILLETMKKCLKISGFFELQYVDYYIDTALFLMKRMTSCQQMEAFESDRVLTLQFLLHWPFQCIFFETANLFHDKLSTLDVIEVLCSSSRMDKRKYKDRGSYDLFKEYWRVLPASRREDIINHSIYRIDIIGLFWALIKAEHAEGILLVLSDMTSAQREEIMFNFYGVEISNILTQKREWLLMFLQNFTCAQKEKLIIHHNGIHICFILNFEQKWDLLKLFFDECLPTKPRELIEIFKSKLQSILPQAGLRYVYFILGITEYDIEQIPKTECDA